MLVFTTTISILGITLLVWLANRALAFRVCPICAGVAGTWLWLVAAHALGYQIDLVVPALLMGGSVVGATYQLEKKLPSGRPALLWKTLCIPAGFIGAYGLLTQWWGVLLASLGFLALIAFLFLSPHTDSGKEAVGELEKKMKDCC